MPRIKSLRPSLAPTGPEGVIQTTRVRMEIQNLRLMGQGDIELVYAPGPRVVRIRPESRRSQSSCSWTWKVVKSTSATVAQPVSQPPVSPGLSSRQLPRR